MPNSYSQIYLHHVSAVKYRQALIRPEFEIALFKYITGIIQGLNQTVIQINGMPDHIHIAARIRPGISPATFVQKIKSNSSRWVNEQKFLKTRFEWQRGGGTFSIGHRHIPYLVNYIKNQKRHHLKKGFKAEYVDLLKTNGLDFDREYLPEFFEGVY